MIKKQCSFKAENSLIMDLKVKAKKENRSFSNLVETILKAFQIKDSFSDKLN